MPEDNTGTITALANLNNTANQNKDLTSQTLGEIKSMSSGVDKGNRLQERQLADNKVQQDIARENAMELKETLSGLKDGFSFFKDNLKTLGLGGAGGALGDIAEKLQAALNLLMSPLVMLTGFIMGIGKGLGMATKAAKDGGKIAKMFSLPLLAFNAALQQITKLTSGFTKSGGVIWNMRQLFTTFTAGFKGIESINKSATNIQKSVFQIGKFFSGIRTSVMAVSESAGKFGELMSKLLAPFKGLIGAAKAIGTVVGRLFAPLNFIFVAFETITTSMNRFKEEGIFGGIIGAIEGFVKGLITIPLDVLTNGLAWIAGKLGMDTVSEALADFSFTGLLTGFVDGIFNFGDKVVEFFSDGIANAVVEVFKWVRDTRAKLLAKLNPLNWFKKDENPADMKFAGEFNQGGTIPAGQVGIAGERGPEFITGPANVTSTEETASLLGTAERLLGGTNEQREMFGAVDYTEGQGIAAMDAFNQALESAGIQSRVTLDEIKAATEVGIENAEGRIGDLYNQLKGDSLDLSGAMSLSLDDFDLQPSSGNQIALAEDNLADAEMERQVSANAVLNSGNVNSSIVTSTNTIVSGVSTRNSDSISYLNRSM